MLAVEKRRKQIVNLEYSSDLFLQRRDSFMRASLLLHKMLGERMRWRVETHPNLYCSAQRNEEDVIAL